MKIGIVAGIASVHLTLEEVIADAVKAEKDGFDHYWFIHLPNAGYDALSLVTLVGQQTSRIELGTSVVPTYPRHPAAMAHQALTAQVAAGGRLTLGIGPSHDFVIEGMLGMKFDRPARHVREYLEILRAFSEQDNKLEYAGDFYNINVNLKVNQSTPFPILLAALGPKMLKVAGELADGTITWVTGPKTIEEHIVPRITKAAKEAGRPTPRVAIALPIMLTNDIENGKRRVNRFLGAYGKMSNYRRMLDIEGVETPAEVAILGNEKEIENRLRHFASIGVTDFCGIMIPNKENRDESITRTWDALKNMVGKI